VYGIPAYRLPKEVVATDVARLEAVGVKFELDAPIGKAETIDDLLETHDAVFIGTGAGLPKFLNVPGEHLVGVQSANEFLTRVNLMRAYLEGSDTPVSDVVGKNVAVIGGGNTAMDAVRTAARMGADTSTIYYRRTEAEMPARVEEVRHAKEEGIRFEFLSAPTAFHGNDRGVLTSMTLQRMELGEPDDSGRRRPQPIDGAIEEIPVDVVVVAAGNAPNPMLANTPGLEFTRWGTLVVDEATYATTKPRVYAGGDIVTGGATVILAMGAGRTAAASIHRLLTNGPDRQEASEATE
jgi:glutamate synthase (NADPH/NADH) small chain